jgi:hypothetical protein
VCPRPSVSTTPDIPFRTSITPDSPPFGTT